MADVNSSNIVEVDVATTEAVNVKTNKRIEDMNCVELKKELKIRRLRLTGNKSQLIERLKAAVLVEQARAENQDEDDEDAEEEDVEDQDEEDGIDEDVEDEDAEDEGDVLTKKKPKRKMQKSTVQLTAKDVEDMLEKFSGDGHPSVQRWVCDFDEMALLYEWSDLEKVTFAKRLLQGTARRYVNYEKCVRTWPKLRKALLEEFGEVVDSIQIHRELSKRKKLKEESYQDYIYVMMEIASQGDVEQRSIVQYIIEGIPDEPVNKSVLYGARTVKQLKSRLQDYEAMKKEAKHKIKLPERKEEKSQHATKEQKKKNIDGGFDQERRCFNCGEKNHRSTSCPHKEKGVKCFKCNEFGAYDYDKKEISIHIRGCGCLLQICMVVPDQINRCRISDQPFAQAVSCIW